MIEKKNSGINLERWLWTYISQSNDDRSQFINNLIKEEIKETLMMEKIMSQDDQVTELYGHVYLNLLLYKRKMKQRPFERIPVKRSVKKTSEDCMKQPIGILLEKWIWDLTGRVEPNRSLFIKKLLLNRIKKELRNSPVTISEKFLEDEGYIMKMYFEIHEKKIG